VPTGWNVVLCMAALAAAAPRIPGLARDLPSAEIVWRSLMEAGRIHPAQTVIRVRDHLFGFSPPVEVLRCLEGRGGAVVLEDGVPLSPVDPATTRDMADIGPGRYLRLSGAVVFTASDGSDPRTSGRSYGLLVAPGSGGPLADPDLGGPAWRVVRSLFGDGLAWDGLKTDGDAVRAVGVRLSGAGVRFEIDRLELEIGAAGLSARLSGVRDVSGGPVVEQLAIEVAGPPRVRPTRVEVRMGGGGVLWTAASGLEIDRRDGLLPAVEALVGGRDGLVGWTRWLRAHRLRLGEGVEPPDGPAPGAGMLMDELAAMLRGEGEA